MCNYWADKSYDFDTALKSANHPKDRLGKCSALSSYHDFASFWLYCMYSSAWVIFPASPVGSSVGTDAAVPIEKRSISLWSIRSFWSRLRTLDKGSINFPACSLSRLPPRDSAVTQDCTVIPVSSGIQGLLGTTLRWLSFENPCESFVLLNRERF